LKSVVDSGATIKDLEYFTSIAVGMPGKGKVQEMIK
jgi:hypothetical protein